MTWLTRLQDCDKVVASKFFPLPDQPPGQVPLCEVDYFRRLDLLCFACGGALRGSYITALDRKYHIEHFTCSICPTVFGAQDSYYEHESNVYCHYHYSTRFAQQCNGCHTAILKQFVEIFRNGVNQHWHPECYMIHKYWNVRLHAGPSLGGDGSSVPGRKKQIEGTDDANEDQRRIVKDEEDAVEAKVHWIWQTLSAFEERSATCISDMLLHVSNGAYMDGIVAANKFITHVDVLFAAADDLDHRLHTRPAIHGHDASPHPGLSYSREAKLLCKKVVAFFQLLAENQDNGVRRLGVTQELLSLVTGLAHYLKLMIRICLSGALKLERETETAEGLESFLEEISKLEDRLEAEAARDSPRETAAYVERSADTCVICNKAVEDKCYRTNNKAIIHSQCLTCATCNRDLTERPRSTYWSEQTQRIFCDQHAPGDTRAANLVVITRLQQYVHLLRVAHARLLATLRTSGALPHTSDDPNLLAYDSREGHTPTNDGGPPLLRSTTRSKSYAGTTGATRQQTESMYEDTMGDIKRLRSTRMEKQLSNATRRARTSRIIDGPEGMRPGSADGTGRRRTGAFQIVEDGDADQMTQLTLGRQDTMTLDDIPRIVQAQQTREQRPNASRYARQPMIPQEPKPRLINGQTRDFSGNDMGKVDSRPVATKKYFSELTALEYFIVRHVAVLNMEPLLEGHFNQEELLDLIETKRPTFWSKFGKAFQPKEKKPKVGKGAIFAVPLEQLLERDYEDSTDGIGPGSLRIPSLVQEAITAMKTMDMSVEGVFRKNGNIKRLNTAKDQIDAKGAVDVDLTKENAVQVAALLKKFLRELPDPLLTYKLHKLWITAAKIEDRDRMRRVLHLTCCLLPKAHRDTMEVLFTFLNWVSSFSHVDEESGSKMDVHNLATVITPNVLHRGNIKEDVPGVDDSFLAIEAVNSLIECNESMCEVRARLVLPIPSYADHLQVPEDLALILNDSTLFSNNAEMTTKEILKRYGERAKAPTVQASTAPAVMAVNGTTSPPPSAPVVTRVDRDPNQQTAWRNESSVRHVGSDPTMTPPNVPYLHATGTGSAESHGGSPSRGGDRASMRSGAYDKQRAMGMA